jgi:hypothetical protein
MAKRAFLPMELEMMRVYGFSEREMKIIIKSFKDKHRFLVTRMTDELHKDFAYYGARFGTDFDYLHYEGFFTDLWESFCDHVAKHEDRKPFLQRIVNTSIDRTENDVSYFRDNVRWNTREGQANNKEMGLYGNLEHTSQ